MKWDTSVWGIRVVPTEEAIEQGIVKKDQRGILLGFHGEMWKVIKSDTTTTTAYHKSFWMRADGKLGLG